jgi:hypothetical protein
MMLFGLLGLLIMPPISISGLAVGALAWRKWHLIPGSVIPPLTFWAFYRDTFRDNEALQVLPVAWLFGLIWSLTAHSVRRQLTT